MKKIATLVFTLGWAAATLYTYSKRDVSHEVAPGELTPVSVIDAR